MAPRMVTMRNKMRTGGEGGRSSDATILVEGRDYFEYYFVFILGLVNIFIIILAVVALVTIVYVLPKQLRKISQQLNDLIEVTKKNVDS